MNAHQLRVIPGGRANFVTEAPPREWSQDLLGDLVLRYRAQRDELANRVTWLAIGLVLSVSFNVVLIVLDYVKR